MSKKYPSPRDEPGQRRVDPGVHRRLCPDGLRHRRHHGRAGPGRTRLGLRNFYYTKRAGLHFLRCFSGLIALVAIFIALRSLPLATVVSISFAAPIFTTIFSIFLLSEKVGIYRWLAVLVGFIGILIITEPGITSLNVYYIFPIIFCIGLSYVAITIRKLSTSESVVDIKFFIITFFKIKKTQHKLGLIHNRIDPATKLKPVFLVLNSCSSMLSIYRNLIL